MVRLLVPALAAAILAGCTTPYPNPSSLQDFGASVDANRAPRGSRAFCDNYARQTAANTYETNSDAEDSFGSNSLARRQAEDGGDRAYQRCLAGRTN